MRQLFLSVIAILLLSVTIYGQDKSSFTVATDGTGDFTSIQKAIDNCKAFPDKRITIFVKNGTYREKIEVPSVNTKVSIIGENAEKTIITFGDYFGKINRGRNSTFYTNTFRVEANDFRMENITIENGAGPVGQAIALQVTGDRCVFCNCRFLGNQDTVYAAGEYSRMLFTDCYFEGTTDFIFGEATALFEKCTLHCKANSFITAASTSEGKRYGLVFQDCKITAAEGVTNVYLGRPWRSFAKVFYLNCEMGPFITPEGWNNWGKAENEKTATFSEYNNSGQGARFNQRVKWSHQLSSKEALLITRAHVLAPPGRMEGFEWYILTK